MSRDRLAYDANKRLQPTKARRGRKACTSEAEDGAAPSRLKRTSLGRCTGLAIATKPVTSCPHNRGRMLSFFRRRYVWPEVPADEIRKRARVVVIDDAEFPYLELFRRDGYTVDKWNDVIDLQKLEAGYYDIILLDIQDVGKAQSADQGLGVIRHLKRIRPAQIVIAYSGADYRLKFKEFFDLADATLDKAGDYVEFKRVVDDLLADRFSIGFYLDKISEFASHTGADALKLRSVAQGAILRRNPRRLERLLVKSGADSDTANLILQIAQTGIDILSMFVR